MHQVFTEFALILLVSAVAGAIALRLRQPLLIAYIVVGIVVSPSVLGLVSANSQINLLAQVGITVLLFLVGLKLDLLHIRHIGPVALAAGLGQLAFTIFFGFVIVVLLERSLIEALYVAIAITFSSTIIIVKLLSDRRELDSLHGRIAVGILIIQDLAVVIAMMAISAIRTDGEDTALMDFLIPLAGRIVVAGIALFVFMRWVLPRLIKTIARSQELLLVFAIAWGVGLAALGEWAQLSKEAGAFIAGFSLASSGYRDAISARLAGIRDFLLLFFFIDLGSRIDISLLGNEVFAAVVLSAFVLLGKPLIVMAIMGYMGYRKRTGFLTGLSLAQISEFSIIFMAMSITLGHLGEQALSLTTLVGLITITLSTYLILYSHPLYDRLAPYLRFFEKSTPEREIEVEEREKSSEQPEVIVIGLGRYGKRLAIGLKDSGLKVLGVDFDPEVASEMRALGIATRYGDGIDENFLHTLPLENTRWVVSTLPDLEAGLQVLRAMKDLHYGGDLAFVAREDDHGMELKKAGAPFVLYPMQNAVDHTVEVLEAMIHPK